MIVETARLSRKLMPSVEPPFVVVNNLAENSHKPTRERVDAGLKSPGAAQRFLSAFGVIGSHFRPRRTCWRPPVPVELRFGAPYYLPVSSR